MKSLVCLFVSVLLMSCSEKKSLEMRTLSVYDSISVSIDYPILSEYVIGVPYCKGDSIYVTGYNHYNHSIDFVNLSGGDNFIVTFQKEGPNGVLPVQLYCFVGDKIVCRDRSGILTLAMDGSVIDRLPRKDLETPAEQYSLGVKGLYNYRYLNNLDDKVLIPLSPIEKGGSVHIGKMYDVSLGSLEFLSPCYPPKVVDNVQYLEGLSIPDINIYDTDKIVYNFPFSSLVYLYDQKIGKTKVLDIRSGTIDNELDFDEWKDMSVVDRAVKEYYMSRFGRVYYSPLLEKYYRVHYGAEEKGGGKPRNMYLMVFDESGDVIEEYLLPSQFSVQYFFFEDTLYFACRNSNDDSFNIARIRLGEL